MKAYKNPWYDSRNPVSKKEYLITKESKIEEYKGFYIVRGVNPWVDVVQCVNSEHCCVSQVGSIRYAKDFIDNGCVYGNYTTQRIHIRIFVLIEIFMKNTC